MRWEDGLNDVLICPLGRNQTKSSEGWTYLVCLAPLFPPSKGPSNMLCCIYREWSILLYKGMMYEVKTIRAQSSFKDGKRKSGLTSGKDGKGVICLTPKSLKWRMQSLPCALGEVIQSTHNFTAMTICTRMNKLQGHGEGT